MALDADLFESVIIDSMFTKSIRDMDAELRRRAAVHTALGDAVRLAGHLPPAEHSGS